MSKDQTLVLVTGGTGFISQWTINYLLEEGYRVRATVRDPKSSKCDFLKKLPGASERLELVGADLSSPNGWKEAVSGSTYVMHIASPYILSVKDAKRDLVDPAVNGTLFVLKACKESPEVKRVVLTSSIAAVSDCFDEWETHTYGPDDWNTTSSLSRNPYYYSKVLAEKAAHEFIKTEKPGFDLVVINPFVVMGPAIDTKASVNQSLDMVVQMLTGKLPMNLPLAQGIVDVRDVATAHVRALTASDAANKRFLLCSNSLQQVEIAKIVKEVAPEKLKRNVHTGEPKGWLPKGLVVFFVRLTQGKDVATYLSTNWGKNPKFDVSLAKSILKIEFRTAEESLRDSVKWICDNNRY